MKKLFSLCLICLLAVSAMAQNSVWVDLGLPSGTLWKSTNEKGGYYTYNEAVSQFGNKLPTREQLEELKNECEWTFTGNGYKVTGPNGEYITLPGAGYRDCGGDVGFVNTIDGYWSSTPFNSDFVWFLLLNSSGVGMYGCSHDSRQLVRLVQ